MKQREILSPSDQARSPRRAVHSTGWLLAAALLAARLLPMGVQPGMFFDGATYATIARNMASGVGDFWHPVFFAESGTAARDRAASGRTSPQSTGYFHDQPPLAFWLESLLFRALGDHFWVEKLYSALTGIGTALLIAAIWRTLLAERAELADWSWLPVVLWLAVPHWSWLYGNNMLENTLGLSAMAAVYALLRAARSRGAALLGWTALAAAAVVGAVLSKGPVGLFPLAAPLGIALIVEPRRPERNLLMGGLLVLLFGLFFGVILLDPSARAYLNTYYLAQVQQSLAGQREIFHEHLGRFYILVDLAGQLIAPAAIAGGVIYRARLRRGVEQASSLLGARTGWKPVLLCLWVAISASLPIMLSPKQSGHYAAPSYPFYALAIGLFCVPSAIDLLRFARSAAAIARIQRRARIAALAGMGAVAVLCCIFAGRPCRDKDVYHDAIALGRLLPRGACVGVSSDLATDWPLQMYLGRWDDIGVDAGAGSARDFQLAPAGGNAPAGYVAASADLLHYQLFQRANPKLASRGNPSARPDRQ